MRLASSRSPILIHHLFGGRPGARIHAHIQRPVRLKTESSARLVELQAAHSEVGQQTIHRRRLHVLGDAAEGLADQRDLRRLAAQLFANPGPAAPWPDPAPRDRDRNRSDVPAGPSRREDAFGMSGQAQRAVHVRPTGAHAEKIQSLHQKEPAHGVLSASSCAPPEGLNHSTAAG